MAKVPFTEKRSWGEFRQFTAAGEVGVGESSTVKTIFIRKGESLSLQRHALRSEFWRVLSGEPEITIGKGEDGLLHVVRAKKGDEFSIEVGIEHRIAAPVDDIEILEISRGIFKEDDIVRIEDKYGRVGGV